MTTQSPQAAPETPSPGQPFVCLDSSSPAPRTLRISVAAPVSDDGYHALLAGIPDVGSCLWSLPQYVG